MGLTVQRLSMYDSNVSGFGDFDPEDAYDVNDRPNDRLDVLHKVVAALEASPLMMFGGASASLMPCGCSTASVTTGPRSLCCAPDWKHSDGLQVFD